MGWIDLAKRLERMFGLGEHPNITRRLYARLEREVQVYGDGVHAIITEVAMSAATKQRPAIWFRHSVSIRLKEAGYLRPGKQPTAEQVTECRAALAGAIDKIGVASIPPGGIGY